MLTSLLTLHLLLMHTGISHTVIELTGRESNMMFDVLFLFFESSKDRAKNKELPALKILKT